MRCDVLCTMHCAGMPVKFSGTPCNIRRPPPTLGEHTDSVLREFGIATDR
jgi:crotonobetainyl-CoA:carnitine CoA-transferase CaiB-like acyl-CoA transferase